MAEAADAAVRRGLRLGKNVDQTVVRLRIRYAKPDALDAAATAGRSIESRITACPITKGLSDRGELPITITTLCISSMPAEEEATDE